MAIGRIVVAALAVLSMPAMAQDTVVVRRGAQFPRIGVSRWAVDLFNAAGTTRAFGPFTVAEDQTITGDLAVVDGPVTVLGTVTGNLVAINADVRLEASAAVDGDVVVLGGLLDESPDARLGGTLRRQSELLDVRREGDRLILIPRDDYTPVRERPRRSYFTRSRGDASILVGLGGTYNRIEGLPLRLGAGIDWTAGAIDGRIRGWGVFRTAGDFDGNRRDLGYQAEAQLSLGRGARITLGGRAFDLVVPTQDWPLTRHEVGWASLLWHRDYRDYFLQRGLAGWLRIEPVGHLTIQGEVARVDEMSIAARDPWTPFRNGEVWRANPDIDQGDFTLLTGMVEIDNRRDGDWSRGGWLLRGTWEHGIGENVIGRPLPGSIRDPVPSTDYTFDRVSADVRRYQPIGWEGELRLRGWFAGVVGNGPLPVQRRYSLGGPDPMNGYAFRAIACNAGVGDPALPGLCDRVLLFQAEYRGGLFGWFDFDPFDHRSTRPNRSSPAGMDWDWDMDWDDWFDIDGPTIVLFSNAGAGWIDSRSDGIPSLSWDVGAGVEMGSVGLYVARAIKSDEPFRVTLRIEGRF